MTTYNTGNPLGSKDPRDLYDNAENFDTAVNSRENEAWYDRFGVERKTLYGMEEDFQSFLINSGYEHIGDYDAGLEITARNQVFWRDGDLYRAGASLALPYTTTGDWGDEEGLFVAVGDQALRQQLADHIGQENGAGMIGFNIGNDYESGTVGHYLSSIPSTINLDPSKNDASEDIINAITNADGMPLRITRGEWRVKNIELENAVLYFDDGAYFVSDLGPEDNCIKITGNTKLFNPNIKITNVGQSPAHGGLGNAITIGEYVTDGTTFDNIEIHNPRIESLNVNYAGIAISMLGRVQGVHITGKSVISGAFGGGIQAHWGGVFDGGDPHGGDVEVSYHPNNIHIDSVDFGISDATGLGGHLALSISASYDFCVNNIENSGWDRTTWIQPGDVYDLVATDEQKSLIMSGIRIGYTSVINPKENETSYNNILISGISATIRTAGQTQSVMATDRLNMNVDHGEVVIVSLPGHTYTTNPIARMVCAKNSRIDVTFNGFNNTVNQSLFQSIGSVGCYAKISGNGSALLVSGRNNVNNEYVLGFESRIAIGERGPSHRAVILGSSAGTATTGSSVPIGATQIPISSWSGISAEYLPKGMRLYRGFEYVTLSRSQLVGPGVSSIFVEPVQFSVDASTPLRKSGTEIDSIISGSIVGAYTAIELVNTDGVSVPAHIRKSAKHDILLSGERHRRALFNGVYSECGQLNDGSLLANIHLGVEGVIDQDVSVRGARFEQNGITLVSSNVYKRSSNNESIGLVVTDCDLNSLSYPVNYLWPTDEGILNLGPPQVFGNRRKDAMSASGHDFDPQQGATAYFGGVYHIYRNGRPGAGSWPAGSRWFSLQPTDGGVNGEVRTAAGTWVAV